MIKYAVTLIIIISLTCLSLTSFSQVYVGGSQTNGSESNNIITAVPFLLITPDARTGAMGNVGVATPGDVNSGVLNPAKFAFLEKNYGIGFSYSPWLRNITSDVNISYLSGYLKLDDKNTIATSLRYFSLGNVQLTDANQQLLGITNPNELAIDVSYARSFGTNFSLGTSIRYINSNLNSSFSANAADSRAGNGVSADIGVLYTTPSVLFGKNAVISTGINISNIGTKIGYTDAGPKFFLPSNLKLGGSATIILDDYSDLTFAIDLNKLLVPTQPIYDNNGDIVAGRNPDRSVASGIFGSFSDAPGGFSEELKEVGVSTGMEYWYNKQFALRIGYNYENPSKGNSNYFTIGAGARYNKFNFDFAYLLADVQKSPLAKTLRFGLSYNY